MKWFVKLNMLLGVCLQVDVLLCIVSTDMNLKRNAICNSLVQNGGPELEVGSLI